MPPKKNKRRQKDPKSGDLPKENPPKEDSPSDEEEEEDLVDPALLAAIRQVVKEEMKTVNSRLKKIEDSVAKLVELQKRVDDVERAVQDTSDKLDKLVKEILPAMVDHMAQVSESLAQQTLRGDVHSRKWNMIIHGIDGAAGEEEFTTRSKCLGFARDVLRVADVEKCRLAACHRLSRKENAGIIIRFCDLAQKDQWFAGTKHLRGHPKRISVSPDIPPVLRPMKDGLMKQRSQLEPDQKSKSKVRYLPIWPFVELKIDGQSPIRPSETLSQITQQIIGFDHVMKINL